MPTDLISLVMYGGALGSCLVFIIGLMKQSWLMYAHHREVIAAWEKAYAALEAQRAAVEKERDEYKQMLFDAYSITGEAVRTVAKVKGG